MASHSFSLNFCHAAFISCSTRGIGRVLSAVVICQHLFSLGRCCGVTLKPSFHILFLMSFFILSSSQLSRSSYLYTCYRTVGTCSQCQPVTGVGRCFSCQLLSQKWLFLVLRQLTISLSFILPSYLIINSDFHLSVLLFSNFH